ncbi:hypothetical protein [Neorhizobium petrolearium]|uniref:hypothetical protein n=1 Tax=Neorhizobium petrolearium TaxID=515361 RepID=UPI001F1E4253|nr:hypothetical protein [Neorhizobium petrolearium]
MGRLPHRSSKGSKSWTAAASGLLGCEIVFIATTLIVIDVMRASVTKLRQEISTGIEPQPGSSSS